MEDRSIAVPCFTRPVWVLDRAESWQRATAASGRPSVSLRTREAAVAPVTATTECAMPTAATEGGPPVPGPAWRGRPASRERAGSQGRSETCAARAVTGPTLSRGKIFARVVAAPRSRSGYCRLDEVWAGWLRLGPRRRRNEFGPRRGLWGGWPWLSRNRRSRGHRRVLAIPRPVDRGRPGRRLPGTRPARERAPRLRRDLGPGHRRGHVRTLRRPEFDCALLDLGLPDSEGLDALHRLHRGESTDRRRRAHRARRPDPRRQALEVGAQDYLTKATVSRESLNRSIRYAIARRRGEETARRLRDAELFRRRELASRARALGAADPRTTTRSAGRHGISRVGGAPSWGATSSTPSSSRTAASVPSSATCAGTAPTRRRSGSRSAWRGGRWCWPTNRLTSRCPLSTASSRRSGRATRSSPPCATSNCTLTASTRRCTWPGIPAPSCSPAATSSNCPVEARGPAAGRVRRLEMAGQPGRAGPEWTCHLHRRDRRGPATARATASRRRGWHGWPSTRWTTRRPRSHWPIELILRDRGGQRRTAPRRCRPPAALDVDTLVALTDDAPESSTRSTGQGHGPTTAPEPSTGP